MDFSFFFAAAFLAYLSTVFAQHGPVAIEVRFERLENPIAIRDDGRRCDVMSNCDMRVQFHVDTESATLPWPGAKKDISSWYLVDLPANTNMVSLFKTLVARRVSNEYKVDNENKLLVNFRILAEDRDVFTHYDIIERFDCPFSGIPANADKQAEWHPPRDQSPMQCHGEIHYVRPIAERPTIYFRWRIYKTEIATRGGFEEDFDQQLPYEVAKLRTSSSSSRNRLASPQRPYSSTKLVVLGDSRFPDVNTSNALQADDE